MGIVDKAKQMLSGHSDTAKKGVDKAADKADDMTGGKYGDQIDMGAEKAKEGVDSMSDKSGNVGQNASEDPMDKSQNMGQNAMDAAQEQANRMRNQ
jgi:MT0933-like antitoxin protein